jgi:putative ATP-dependent endonuclease of the OLD family
MKVRRLFIANFRGVKSAEIHFPDHVLLVGHNNVGKSTVLEALDLVLGPERSSRQNAIQEHDFYLGRYLSEQKVPVPIHIEATLTDLSEQSRRAFRDHLEWWDCTTQKLVESDGVEKIDVKDKRYTFALRVAFRAQYDPTEDEFATETFFCHPPTEEGAERASFGRKEKRLCGFLYLRSLRTGTRALSLEKGSLFDTILQLKEVQAQGLWEDILNELRGVGPTLVGHSALQEVLRNIESHVTQYIPLASEGNSTELQVTELTREHLRRNLMFFLRSEPSNAAVPFQHSGSGTLNVLVLALLSFIAELKETVIFAMEEPETALPPCTQRRIAQLAKVKSTQCILTSHSPYIAECFVPNHLLVLRRGPDHRLNSMSITTDAGIKKKILHRDFRLRFAEGILSRGILAVEGISEVTALSVASELLAAADSSYSHLDLSGVSIIERSGDGGLEALGTFFRSLGIRTFAFYDRPNDPTLIARLLSAFDHVVPNPRAGLERLLAEELPLARVLAFCDSVGERPDAPTHLDCPGRSASEAEIRRYAFEVLKSRKGEGYAADLLRTCGAADLPASIVTLLKDISSRMDSASPKPSPTAPS